MAYLRRQGWQDWALRAPPWLQSPSFKGKEKSAFVWTKKWLSLMSSTLRLLSGLCVGIFSETSLLAHAMNMMYWYSYSVRFHSTLRYSGEAGFGGFKLFWTKWRLREWLCMSIILTATACLPVWLMASFTLLKRPSPNIW